MRISPATALRKLRQPSSCASSSREKIVALRVAGLTKRYGTTIAVSGLNFEIGEGEIFGLLGPNGAGKTTTIAMLATQRAALLGRCDAVRP